MASPHLVTLLMISISRAFLPVAGLALLLVFCFVGGPAGLLIAGLALLLVLCPVGLLTDRLVGSVAVLLVVCLVAGLIHCLTSLLIGHRTFGLIGCLIDGFVNGVILHSAFWSISMTGSTQQGRSYHKLKCEMVSIRYSNE